MQPAGPGIGEALGAIIGALGSLAEPSGDPGRVIAPVRAEVAQAVDDGTGKVPEILVETPPQAALRLSVPGRLIDLGPDDLGDVRPSVDPQTGRPVLMVTLGPDAASWLGATTAAHVGQPMDLSVCGEVLMSPVIQSPITGGEIMLSGNFTTAELQALASAIQGTLPCTDLLSQGYTFGQ